MQRRQAGAVTQVLRLRHRDAALGQVIHQFDVERQLRLRQDLEQGQDVFAPRGVQKVIGVLDTGRNPPKRNQLAQVELRQKGARVVVGYGSEYGH